MGALHSISDFMGPKNPMVQATSALFGVKTSSDSPSPSSSQIPTSQLTMDSVGLGLKRPAQTTLEETPTKEMKIQDQPSDYNQLKNLGAHDLYNIPESPQSAQYKISSMINILPTDYTMSEAFQQFRENVNYLSNRNLLSKHELNSWIQTMTKSQDPIEDYIRPEDHQQLEQQVSKNPAILHELSLHPEQLIEWMHQPLSPLSYAIMFMGTLEHGEWTPERKQIALRSMQQESQNNPMMKQGLNWVQQALQATGGKIQPENRPSYNVKDTPKNLVEGGGGVHQGGSIVKGATDIFEGYTAYKTGSQIGNWARKAEQAVQGETAISAIVGAENAAKLAGQVSRVAPVAERLGEVGAVVGIAEGVNELTTAIGLTKENYVGEAIGWVENKIEDGFQNVIHGIGHIFGF